MSILFNKSHFSSSREIIRYLIIATCSITFLAALSNPLFHHYFNTTAPYDFLALSWKGITSFYFWQPVSYVFVHNSTGGVSLSTLIELLFNMYMLWIAASALTERLEGTTIFKIYLIAALAGGLTALPFLSMGFGPSLNGAGPAVFSLLLLWTLFSPENEMLLLGNFTVKLKWLTLSLLGISIALDLSVFNIPSAIAYFAGSLTGYLYGITVCNLEGCYPGTRYLDQTVRTVFQKATDPNRHSKRVDDEIYKNAKIFDIKSGDPLLDDDSFMDAMLNKISMTGEKSLSKKERKRMQDISEKKAKQRKH